MYGAFADPYCYRDTPVLRNNQNIRDQQALAAFEAAITTQRATEIFPSGRLSVSHFLAIHRHLFQDVYRWAGCVRTVRLSKDNNMFCYPEHIRSELRALFYWLKQQGYLRHLTANEFSREAAHFLAELNAIHAFRDGNGRTQLIFSAVLAERAGHPMTINRLDPDAFLAAMIKSFQGNEHPLAKQLLKLID